MIAKAVRAFFERVATDRDAMRLAYYDERVIEKMAAVSGLIGAMIAADVGTGTGFVAAGLAPRAGTVVGGDNSPAMPAAASRNLDTWASGTWSWSRGTPRPCRRKAAP